MVLVVLWVYHRSFNPTSDPVEQMARCQELCEWLAEDMEKEGIQASASPYRGLYLKGANKSDLSKEPFIL